MALLIDGYNLLHASGIMARGVGPATLERSRAALLNFLVESLAAGDIRRTIVVFDAGASANGRVRSAEHRGIQVRFSAGKSDADDLIEELIRADSAPRRLTVVSSDHRIQRAAHRRRAQAIDSDKWFAAVWRSRVSGDPEPGDDQTPERRAGAPGARRSEPEQKSVGGLSEHEVTFWLRRFGLDEQSADVRTPDERPPRPDQDKPTSQSHPFPPGYAEDVAEDEE
jgi:predicted RNA-binding protein with PIN domain